MKTLVATALIGAGLVLGRPDPELDDAQTGQVLLFLAYDGEAPK